MSETDPINPFSLAGKRILVTGASSGIGRACAVVFSQMGASVTLVARRKDALEETLGMMASGLHRTESFDLSVGDAIVPWIKGVALDGGAFDGLVHSAGVAHVLPIRAVTSDLYTSLMAINLDAAYWLSKGFRQKEVRKTRGSVVLVSSVLGLVGQPGASAYCASKGGLITLAKALGLEFAKERINVNVIASGHVQTNITKQNLQVMPEENFKKMEAMHPLGIGSADDVALAAAFLLSDAAKWMTGSVLTVDGGYTAA